jgi:26S proteasome regulatory subunit T4
MADTQREAVVRAYQEKLREHNELEKKVKDSNPHPVREELNRISRDFDKTEEDLKALQNTGQIIGEVLKQVDEDRCKCYFSHSKGFEWASVCDRSPAEDR